MNELSTVEWQSAHVIPTRVRVSLPLTISTVPLTPTTAPSLINATVVAGSSNLTAPLCTPATTSAGIASASTLSPTASAIVGGTVGITCSIIRVSVQNVSSPKVSLRKMSFPCIAFVASMVGTLLLLSLPHPAAVTPASPSTLPEEQSLDYGL